ncbi:hypothetical protein MOC98_01535 [Bacillus spizizenii]|jgi:hypothetical protein|uniref:Uncharacterized protein n=2 Tax=Bacillus spizizenii TaxID=96241 RepID=G4NTP7_BACS4|nr:hypothetical protein [Bacillus spizizenii]MBK4205687.1 hypothetical protein [Bacillus subtilis]AEP85177.1 hypothetical protein GYO_0462 [Bacillus spizizenii TU-B-10]MCI4169773.1 hypothetical protein [Bacillus spizizenii]MCY8451579.1 hypothetical protein [Bacillus spizizenii]MCY8458054.1 hypothetical protein [Bacillus spizizenii]
MGGLQTTGYAENAPFSQLSARFSVRLVSEDLFLMFSAYNRFTLLHSHLTMIFYNGGDQ